MSALSQVSGTFVEITYRDSDLTLCDFWAFPTLKHELLGHIFKSDRRVTHKWQLQMYERCQKMFLKWVESYKNVYLVKGITSKKETMPNPQDCLRRRTLKVVSFLTEIHS
jgi:hypothetical protein